MSARVAFVGVGHRATRFIEELAQPGRSARIVGFCDVSAVRMAAQNRWLREKHGHAAVPEFSAAQFEEMIRATAADTVVVATVDSEHHSYIGRSLAMNCDVITEKPMTTDASKCRAILAAARVHPERRVTVAFNYRWAPTNTKIKELLASHLIGDVKSVNLEWQLDLRHGADYFRRWHSEKQCSGGLLVHKATHHFDLVNWWTDSIPRRVYATGGLKFYGEANAKARGQTALTGYPRYTGESRAQTDPFAIDLAANPHFKALYLDAERETGYVRDRNVFRPGIDIEDDVSVLVDYRNGLVLTYSLNAFSPREGMRVVFNGTRGRLEYHQFEKSNGATPENDEGHLENREDRADKPSAEGSSIRVYPHDGKPYDVPTRPSTGGHWGGDPLLTQHLFGDSAAKDEWGRVAGHEQGAASILVGIAANESLASRMPVSIDSLVPLRLDATCLSELI
ncbi:MAG: Gfo/Idh/MocA family oxidoreductase [Candidatus Didemnitutus sp.]|nr:Gfo/Idh/MocA family oxidoreductase [Candidatus Didemnitutus sp.]